MRDKDQERATIRYIENNSTESKLCQLTSDWPCSSVRFRDEYHHLKIIAHPE